MAMTRISEFLADESGATSIEYVLIASIVSVCMIISLRSVSTSLQGTMNAVSTRLNSNGK